MDNLFPIYGTGDPGLVLIDGIINLSGSTTGSNQNVAITHNLVGVTSVARLSTGSYQVTLDQSYPALKSCHVQVSTYNPLFSVEANLDYTHSDMVNSGTQAFFITSGSSTATGNRVLYDPTGSINVHVALALKKSSA